MGGLALVKTAIIRVALLKFLVLHSQIIFISLKMSSKLTVLRKP